MLFIVFVARIVLEFLFPGNNDHAPEVESPDVSGHKVFNEEGENTVSGELENDSLNVQTLDIRMDSSNNNKADVY